MESLWQYSVNGAEPTAHRGFSEKTVSQCARKTAFFAGFPALLRQLRRTKSRGVRRPAWLK
jgi:hypothetical protein